MLEESLNRNIQQIEKTIQAALKISHRDKNSVTLVCVSKSVDLETTQQVVDLGIHELAENRVEKLLHKKSELVSNEPLVWHFIGNLQRRKVKEIINEIDYFHALDTLKLAGEINKRAEKDISCFIQVNVSGESSKQGIRPEELDGFIEALQEFSKVKVVGLMTMAPFDSSNEELRNIFRTLNQLKQSIEMKQLSYAPCHELSMGMSGDFEIAIEEGSTFVRVGSSFFDKEEKEVEER
ncbi:MAG: YggS family pyridoxal phosphate-dependent enzyme [Vagococcus sp.]